MSRTAQSIKNNFLILAAVVALGVGAIAATVTEPDKNAKSSKTSTQTSVQQNTITYKGEEGQTALALLKKHAKVQTKTSPGLGEYVVSINGKDGGGKKFWLYYVNDQEAPVGAGAYVTKSSDTIKWKLQ